MFVGSISAGEPISDLKIGDKMLNLSKMIKTGVLDMFYIEELVNSNPQIVEEWDNEEWEGIGMCFAVNCNKTYNECVSQIKTIGGRKDRKIKMNPKAKAKAKEKAKMKG